MHLHCVVGERRSELAPPRSFKSPQTKDDTHKTLPTEDDHEDAVHRLSLGGLVDSETRDVGAVAWTVRARDANF